MEDYIEAGQPELKMDKSKRLIDVNPENDPRYKAIQSQCRTLHAELLKIHMSGQPLAENPALIGDYLGKLRLNCNLFFSFLNGYIDTLTVLQGEYAIKRQNLYEQYLTMPKASPSGAETHSREKTRLDDANIKVIENRIQQIRNEYERYNGICMYLQSRIREFNTERMVG